MTEVISRPIDHNGHMPLEALPMRRTPFDGQAEPDPDFEMWLGYFREQRADALAYVADAFDAVLKDYEAGDGRAAVDVLMFCAIEGRGLMGMADAIRDLLYTHNRAYQLVHEYRRGNDLSSLVDLAEGVAGL